MRRAVKLNYFFLDVVLPLHIPEVVRLVVGTSFGGGGLTLADRCPNEIENIPKSQSTFTTSTLRAARGENSRAMIGSFLHVPCCRLLGTYWGSATDETRRWRDLPLSCRTARVLNLNHCH